MWSRGMHLVYPRLKKYQLGMYLVFSKPKCTLQALFGHYSPIMHTPVEPNIFSIPKYFPNINIIPILVFRNIGKFQYFGARSHNLESRRSLSRHFIHSPNIYLYFSTSMLLTLVSNIQRTTKNIQSKIKK